MSKRLEELNPGTAVLVDEEPVGEVRGVFALGESELAEYLEVFWNERQRSVLVPTDSVLTIGGDGVVLQGPKRLYDDLQDISSARTSEMHKLR